MSRWAGSKVRLHQPRDWAEGGMTPSGTSLRVDFLFREKNGHAADITPLWAFVARAGVQKIWTPRQGPGTVEDGMSVT
jgi:hypothetical protein